MGIRTSCLLLCLLAEVVMADNVKTAARMVVIRPKAGMQKQFEEGYKRHLQWHQANEDPWTWYGWRIVTGERIGHFMDGTFGHDPADFDHAIQPAADAEDNQRNVAPYADFVSHGVFQFRPDLGGQSFLETGNPSRFVEVFHYHVVPGKERQFEEDVRAGKTDGAWYQLKNGGEEALYLLFVPRGGWSEIGSTGKPVSDTAVHCLSSELLLYAADLSYSP